MGDGTTNPSDSPTMGEIISRRYSRRGILRSGLATAAIGATVSPMALLASDKTHAATKRFDFKEITAGVDARHHVAEGYDAEVLLRWGDPLFADAPDFDPLAQTADAQARQFGYNNDFVGLVPMPDSDDPSEHGLLVANHEYTIEELMFPGMVRQDGNAAFASMTPELIDIEMMAHGGSVVEIRKRDGKWQMVRDSKFNRRITAETEMEITGPAASHDLLQTAADSSGSTVRGMLNNCAGGVTPWGTWLSAEENFHGYFWVSVPQDGLPELPEDGAGDAETRDRLIEEREEMLDARREEILGTLPEAAAMERYGVPGGWYVWAKTHDRFDVVKEPNEANRFGWVVEIDPQDPASTPKKRTALGRMKHEGAETIVNKDGRVVVYMGDDERFDYVYKFVTSRSYDPSDRSANMDLLDEGTLFVARYDESGEGAWLPLVHGEGPLTAENGFRDQAEVLVKARLPADALGATRMDRPEDVSSSEDGRVFVMLTNNTRRKEDDTNAANPRADNEFGHIIEMIAPDGDHAAEAFAWNILLQCGDPAIAEVGATFSAETTENGWFGNPDNCVIDADNRLWVSTDGNSAADTGRSDGLWALETEGETRGTSVHFFRCPAGAELCGPFFTPDTASLFVAVQHPAEDGEDWPEFGRTSTFDDPATRWPDFDESLPPRPSVVVITRRGGGKIAG